MPFKTRVGLSLAVCAASLSVAPAAYAGTGCNGVVNIFVWGCAPWDNNNGSKFPYYRKSVQRLPARQTQIITDHGVPMAKYNGQTYPLAGLIPQDGGGVVSNDGGSIAVYVQN